MLTTIHKFKTRAAAEAFKEGVEWANDSSIEAHWSTNPLKIILKDRDYTGRTRLFFHYRRAND